MSAGAVSTIDSEALSSGFHVGAYRIVRRLGKGGMGAVYEAIHETIERRVAVKVLRAEYAQDATSVARLMNEARAVNRVGHPGLVQVYDAGQLPNGSVYILMELLDGVTLATRIAQRRPTLSETLRFSRQIAGAIAAAHEKRIIHRDLKPENIMIVSDPDTQAGERSKILDFGIAKLLERPGVLAPATCPDVVLGTPQYMSPEQCRGAADIDESTDVYSFGAVLFFMLTGRPPFSGTLADVIAQHLHTKPPALSDLCPWVPTSLGILVQDLLAKQS